MSSSNCNIWSLWNWYSRKQQNIRYLSPKKKTSLPLLKIKHFTYGRQMLKTSRSKKLSEKVLLSRQWHSQENVLLNWLKDIWTDIWTKDLSSRQKMNGCSFNNFYGKIWWFFTLTQENALCQRFHFKDNKKSIVSSKKRF